MNARSFQSTNRVGRGGIAIPDDMPDTLTLLQAKVDITNKLLRSQYPRMVELGKRSEIEVREEVRELEAWAEQEELARQIVADCAPQLDAFLDVIGAVYSLTPEQLDAEVWQAETRATRDGDRPF